MVNADRCARCPSDHARHFYDDVWLCDGCLERARRAPDADLLTLTEAADRLGCCVKTLHRLEQRGRVRYVRLTSRAVRVPRALVDALVKGEV